jgi:hypothetical protein
MLKREPYENPPAPYKPGKLLLWEGQKRRVIASTHTHTQLEGIPKAIPNWRLKLSLFEW